MTITLSLAPELELYLKQKSEQQGISIEAYTLQLLTEQVLLREKQSKVVNLLQSWLDEEDTEEQRETGEYLIRALDEDRLSDRKLFPIEMKSVTW
jgi:hypothetical protein